MGGHNALERQQVMIFRTGNQRHEFAGKETKGFCKLADPHLHYASSRKRSAAQIVRFLALVELYGVKYGGTDHAPFTVV